MADQPDQKMETSSKFVRRIDPRHTPLPSMPDDRNSSVVYTIIDTFLQTLVPTASAEILEDFHDVFFQQMGDQKVQELARDLTHGKVLFPGANDGWITTFNENPIGVIGMMAYLGYAVPYKDAVWDTMMEKNIQESMDTSLTTQELLYRLAEHVVIKEQETEPENQPPVTSAGAPVRARVEITSQHLATVMHLTKNEANPFRSNTPVNHDAPSTSTSMYHASDLIDAMIKAGHPFRLNDPPT